MKDITIMLEMEHVLFLSLHADPDGFKGVPMENIGASQKARSIALKEYSEALQSNNVVGVYYLIQLLPGLKKYSLMLPMMKLLN